MSEANGVIERWTTPTPNDNENIPKTDAIHVNVSGDFHFLDNFGNDRTIYLLAGVDYFYAVKRVFNTGTTANGIHAGYFA